jgi:hypothetical protein
MRPLSTKRNALRYPFDSVFGTEAQVRILRVLSMEIVRPISVPEAALLSGLTQPGVRKALDRLVETGLVDRIGSGRSQHYCLREKEPLIQAIGSLFGEEQRVYERIVAALRKAFDDLREVRTALVSQLPKRLGDPLEICVVVDPKAISWIGEEIRTRIIAIEKEFDMIVETVLFTRADAPIAPADAVYLRVAEREKTGTHRPAGKHQEADARSLTMAHVIAELIRSDPSLVGRALKHLNRLALEDQGTAMGDIAEWRQLLETYSSDRLRRLLVSGSSRAVRLRQSSPFLAVLTPDEQVRLIAMLERVT